AAALVGQRGAGLQPDRLGEVGDGQRVLAALGVGDAAVVMRLGAVGLQAQRRLEVGEGAVQVAGRDADVAALGVGLGVVSVQFDHPAEVEGGALELAAAGVGQAAAQVLGGVGGRRRGAQVVGVGLVHSALNSGTPAPVRQWEEPGRIFET